MIFRFVELSLCCVMWVDFVDLIHIQLKHDSNVEILIFIQAIFQFYPSTYSHTPDNLIWNLLQFQ